MTGTVNGVGPSVSRIGIPKPIAFYRVYFSPSILFTFAHCFIICFPFLSFLFSIFLAGYLNGVSRVPTGRKKKKARSPGCARLMKCHAWVPKSPIEIIKNADPPQLQINL